MNFFVLTFLVFTATTPPSAATKYFSSRAECEIAEGEALTGGYNNDQITGWIIVNECTDVGGKPVKG